jgi:hypothetical protein
MGTREINFEAYRDKPVTPLQEHFADWIVEKTGYDPSSAKTKHEAFLRGVALGTALRQAHQASPENQAARSERKVTPEVASEVPASPAKKTAKKAAASAQATEAPEPAATPRRRGGRRAAAATTAPSPF